MYNITYRDVFDAYRAESIANLVILRDLHKNIVKKITIVDSVLVQFYNKNGKTQEKFHQFYLKKLLHIGAIPYILCLIFN